MKKALLILMMGLAIVTAGAGLVGLPQEHIAFPAVQGDYLVVVWDETGADWIGEFENYDHTGSYRFDLPSWEAWYWIGLWDVVAEEYVFEKWVGHFVTD